MTMNQDGNFEVAALTEGASFGRLVMLFVSGLAAAILIVAGIVDPNTELFWVAILPATILAILLFRRPVDRNGYLTSEGIVLESPSLVIPTDQIQGLLLGGLCQDQHAES